jgi:predicted O-methyltransferase YrrM
VTNYFEGGEFPLKLEEQGLRKGRSVHDGYARGWGLEFGGIRNYVLDDPIYQQAMALAQERTIQAENCRMNLFLLAKYFLPRILDESAGGSIVEFGSFRGGSAIFLASVCRSLGLNVKVYGLDTFEGMPPTDKGVDAHNAGDFAGVDLNELRAYVESCGLSEQLEFVQGMFDATAPALLPGVAPVLLAHIDCDVYDSVAFAWEVVKPCMANGGYVAFDDAHTSSCLGATEAVEDLVIRGDGLNCEQIWPHFVFRVWHGVEPVSGNDQAGQLPAMRRPEDDVVIAAMQRAQLQSARGEIARLQQQYLELTDKLKQAQERIRDLDDSLAESRARVEDLNTRYVLLSEQVTMAKRSRWLRLGRLFGVGPEFEIPE